MSATNRCYGRLLKKWRNRANLTQEQLALPCYYGDRRIIIDIEAGKTAPNAYLRAKFAEVLFAPILEYFPHYRIEQFPERLRVRFQHEKKACQPFLQGLSSRDLVSFKEVFKRYESALEQNEYTLMSLLDEYLHTSIMNAHPDEQTRILVGRYRQDYIDFFRVWVPQLDLNIALGQYPVHLHMFQAVINRDLSQLTQAIDLHLENSLRDIERIIDTLWSD